jgi:hypothetical protein
MRRLATVLVAAAVAGTGCGGSAKTPPAAAPRTHKAAPKVDAAALVTSAAAKTMAKGSSKVAMTITSSLGTTVRGVGAFDYGSGNGELTQTISASGRTTKQKILLVAGVAYVSLPGASTGQFFKLDLSALVGRTGGAFDQSSQLALLAGATDSLKEKGSETVRGAKATRLSGTLDVQKALASITDPKVKSGLQSLQRGLHLPKRMRIDVWVDRSGLIRRLTQAYSVPARTMLGQTLPASSGKTTLEYFDFGTRVSVTAPPPSAVLGG